MFIIHVLVNALTCIGSTVVGFITIGTDKHNKVQRTLWVTMYAMTVALNVMVGMI